MKGTKDMKGSVVGSPSSFSAGTRSCAEFPEQMPLKEQEGRKDMKKDHTNFSSDDADRANERARANSNGMYCGYGAKNSARREANKGSCH